MSAPPEPPPLSHLDMLEAEGIQIIREVAAQFERPCMLYSIGKDSTVMLHLARKAFFPGPIPFPLLHVDTTWNFHEMITFRDRLTEQYGLDMRVWINQEGLKQKISPLTHGSALFTDIMNRQALLQALDHYRFDAALGGGRRDEEKSRAKERVFSFRTPQHRWDPKNQRPELWSLYNGRLHQGESIRAFPISNWREVDVWAYIEREKIDVVPLYFAAERPVIERDGQLLILDDERLQPAPGEEVQHRVVRCRTLGCYPLTGAVESPATSIAEIIEEMKTTTTSERAGRLIDRDQAASMEKKKQEGYY